MGFFWNKSNDAKPKERQETEAVGTLEVKEETRPRTEESSVSIPGEMAILPLRKVVAYPLTVFPLSVGQPRSIKLVDDAVVGNRMIGLVAAKSADIPEPGPNDIYWTGTAAIIHRMLKAPDGTLRLIVQGVERIKIEEFIQEVPYLKAKVKPAPDIVEKTIEVEALMRNCVELFRRLVSLVPHLPEELMMAVINVDDPRQLVYLIATTIRMEVKDAQELLELDHVKDKLHKLNALLTRELEVLELGRKIQSQAQAEMEKMQREFFLREQLKAIKKELGEEDEQALEIKELEEKIAKAGMPEEAEKEARRELERLRKMPPAAAEYSVIRTYLDWLTSLPWNVTTEDNLDIERARRILDEDHYDLEKVKERILEYLAVRKLKEERKEEREKEKEQLTDYIRREREGVILCFVGPPGTGKTSLGQSIARALGRKFIRISLGGVRDEAEIRGHRRTYVGALPGRIIQAIRRVGTKNPVFMLDEVDKIGVDFRGDPASALLEVLDPEQNREFRDHYLDVPFDLSQVMFITTANVLDTIPPALRDRMEIIQLSGYTEEEKLQIAKKYLLPRQLRENGLRQDELTISDEAIRKIIREYTREAGVRNLEREIGAICRKVATKVAQNEQGPFHVDVDDLTDYLGKPKYYPEAVERTEMPGVATGLAWTPTGGDILFVEATKMPGKKGFILTGQLGDVMKESAQAALSYVRSKASELGLDSDFFEKHDIHLHVPAGAIPKDGPSAGITMAVALASLLTNRPVRPDIAMTGEITLRGQVLPVGGIKEKVLAAHRAGIKTVILPKRNEPDLADIPEDVRREMKFILVERVDEVFDIAFADGKKPKGKAKNSKGRKKAKVSEEKQDES
ncbi:MAG: endopeptidase La [Chloroflexi bacterium]|nr:MAG: endopeptidase La [Chloroflexota bacterium]HDN81093.1 endopeptidase La [Chloroflexota bacterium]